MSHLGKNCKTGCWWKKNSVVAKCCQFSGTINVSQDILLYQYYGEIQCLIQHFMPHANDSLIVYYSPVSYQPNLYWRMFARSGSLWATVKDCRQMGDSDDQSSNYSCPDNSGIIPPALTKNAFCVTLICISIQIQEAKLNVFFDLVRFPVPHADGNNCLF